MDVGSQLGPYEIVARIGAGGMGEVWRARDRRLQRDVAIKVLLGTAHADDALPRFEREARAVAALSHPNILAIHDFGTESGTRYAVMELLEGATLRERLHQSELEIGRTLDWAHQTFLNEMPPKKFYSLVGKLADEVELDDQHEMVHFENYLAGSRTSLDQPTASITPMRLETRGTPALV